VRPAKNSAPIAAISFKMKTKRFALSLGRYSILLLALTLLWRPAYSQQTGIAEGRLVNRTNPAIIARGATLDIVGLSGGMSVIKTAVADDSGKFRIEGLPVSEPLMIRTNYKGANYHTQLSFNKTGEAHVEIEVYESTDSMAGIQVQEAQIVFQAAGRQLASVETITYNNKTNPPRTYVNPEGSLRVSKAAGILELPKIRVTAPGASMPVVQPALESPDGQSYYSQYPLRPGTTTFEIQQILPYENRSGVFTKKFFQDANSLTIGLIPKDMVLSGPGLSKIKTDSDNKFSIYMSSPVKAGTEVVWKFSGGSAVEQQETPTEEETSKIETMPNAIQRNTLIIGPLLLAGFIVVLWFAFNYAPEGAHGSAAGTRPLAGLREKLLSQIADWDRRYEAHDLSRHEHQHLRDAAKRRLRGISLLMKNRKN
jgi:hypothetical protein